MSIRWFGILHPLWLLLALAPCTPSVQATPLAAGESIQLLGITAGPDSNLAGVVQADPLREFAILDGKGAVVLSGKLQDRVVLSNNTGTLIFAPRLRDLSRPAGSNYEIVSLQKNGFRSFATDVEYRTDGLGEIGPNTARRDIDGASITFSYGQSIPPPQESRFLSIFTDAREFDTSGVTVIVARDARTQSIASVTLGNTHQPLAPGVANIEIVSFSGPSCADLDTNIDLSVTVRNSGSAAIRGTVFAGFYTSNDAQIGTTDRLLSGGREAIAGLAVGEQTTINSPTTQISSTFPDNSPPTGEVFLGVVVDEFDDISESNEQDNSTSTRLAIPCENHDVTSVVFAPISPAALELDERVDITFDYETTELGGVRIFARPFSEGVLSPFYSASGSPLFTSGQGSGTQFFTITEGAVAVDQVRFQMTNADQSQLLLEFFTPVSYQFGSRRGSITVTLNGALQTSEAGSTDSFAVVLDRPPTAAVVIDLTSSDPGEGAVAPEQLIFTANNWNTAQTVTVTGVNDNIDDGDVTFVIVTAPAVSDDAAYDGVEAADVTVTNTDDDTAGVTVDPVNGLITNEQGGQATFTVVLDSQPIAPVAIDLESDDPTEGEVSPQRLTFTVDNWKSNRTVTVSGQDDATADGDRGYRVITRPAISDDSSYDGLDPQDVTLTNNDDDVPGITVNPSQGLITTETGTQASFSMVLNTRPSGSVSIGLISSDPSEGVVNPSSIDFTAEDWDTARTVTVTGVDDDLTDGNIAYTIRTAPAISTDSDYNNIDALDIDVTNEDDDRVKTDITVSSISGNTSETGSTATIVVRLTRRPLENVTIGISSSDTSEARVTPGALIFAPEDWQPKTLTVTGQDDDQLDGSVAFTIVTSASGSADPSYDGLRPGDVRAFNLDDETDGSRIHGDDFEAP